MQPLSTQQNRENFITENLVSSTHTRFLAVDSEVEMNQLSIGLTIVGKSIFLNTLQRQTLVDP